MYFGLNDNGMSLVDVARVIGGELHVENGEAIIYGVSIDTRTVHTDELFFGIPGETFDGNDFAVEAIRRGARCAVVSRVPAEPVPYILVSDTVAALGLLAREYRRRFGTITVAVTGSVGKTTTKQFIYSVLDTKYKTNKTDGNFNNEIGLPLTLFKLNISYKAMVVEMGMNHPGEISKLSRIAEPDIAVITNIGTAHIENLGSREAIRDAKLEILDGMKEDGILLLNGDEPLLRHLNTGNVCAKYMGIENPTCQYNAVNIRKTDAGFLFDLDIRNGEDTLRDLEIRVRGRHNIYNAMAAVVCGVLSGVSEEDIREGLLKYEAVALRAEIEKRNAYTLISDCYNASPESMMAALDVLGDVADGGRRVAVLGEMLELGSFSRDLHKCVGRSYAKGTDLLITVGENARAISDGARENGMDASRIVELPAESPAAIADAIRKVLHDGDTVLFKASRRVALENVVSLL